MKDLEEVLNCISDFSCYISDKLVSFSGTLNNTEKDIELSGALHRCEENYISLIFSPSEIVIGQNNLAELQVTQMSMSISALNYMFSKLSLQYH